MPEKGRMPLNDLYREMRASQKGFVDAAAIAQSTTEANRSAGTAGWTEGVICKNGRIVEAFDKLPAVARTHIEQTRDPDIATLHDALAEPILAVSRFS